ncbi:VTT domain-containing protein [Candidatus Thioglobus sp.]|nr:VTT domain-containing protein [Candidatus Thioglobus sp.]
MQIVLASFILPCSVIAVLAGILWGVEIGIVYSLLATICASSWTFVVGRFLIKDWNSSINIFSWSASVVNLINSHNWKASMIAHANPLFPGSSLGYIFGLSKVGYGNFLFGLIIGTLPLQILVVTFGYFSNRVINLSVDYVIILALFIVVMAIFLYMKMMPLVLDYIKRDL